MSAKDKKEAEAALNRFDPASQKRILAAMAKMKSGSGKGPSVRGTAEVAFDPATAPETSGGVDLLSVGKKITTPSQDYTDGPDTFGKGLSVNKWSK